MCDLVLLLLKDAAFHVQSRRLLLCCWTKRSGLYGLHDTRTEVLGLDCLNSDLHGAWPLKLSISQVVECKSTAELLTTRNLLNSTCEAVSACNKYPCLKA